MGGTASSWVQPPGLLIPLDGHPDSTTDQLGSLPLRGQKGLPSQIVLVLLSWTAVTQPLVLMKHNIFPNNLLIFFLIFIKSCGFFFLFFHKLTLINQWLFNNEFFIKSCETGNIRLMLVKLSTARFECHKPKAALQFPQSEMVFHPGVA